MKALLVLLGIGGLVAGGIALATRDRNEGVTMRRGGWYHFIVLQDAASEGDLQTFGFASITMQEIEPASNGQRAWQAQAVWVGPDGQVFFPPEGMGDPVLQPESLFRGEAPSDVPMQGPSQTTNQSSFLVNFPAQGLVNLDE